jgi:hypothetical protein
MFGTSPEMFISVLALGENQPHSLDTCTFQLVRVEGLFKMVAISRRDSTHIRLPFGYQVGYPLSNGWKKKPIGFDFTTMFNGFAFAKIDDMEDWLLEPANQAGLTSAIKRHFTNPVNKVLEYDVNTGFSLANY